MLYINLPLVNPKRFLGFFPFPSLLASLGIHFADVASLNPSEEFIVVKQLKSSEKMFPLHPPSIAHDELVAIGSL
jgi:hypothetical protein